MARIKVFAAHALTLGAVAGFFAAASLGTYSACGALWSLRSLLGVD